MRRFWRLAVDVLLGAALAFGHAPLSAWYVAVPALFLILYRLGTVPIGRSSFNAGWRVGFGYFVAALSWVVAPFLVEPEAYGWMAPFALVGMAGGLAFFWAFAAFAASFGYARFFMLAGLLSFAELLRGVIFTGFPWALVGQIWVETPFDQLAALIGTTGLTALSFSMVAWMLHRPLSGGCIGVILLCALAIFGALRPELLPAGAPRAVSLRLVQPAIPQHLKWREDRAAAHFEHLLSLSKGDPPADLTIWPETALPYLLEDAPWLGEAIAAAASGPTAIGYQRFSEGRTYSFSEGRTYNSLGFLDSHGRLIARYDKAHLVPFGEYIPGGDWLYSQFGVTAFAAQLGYSFTPGIGRQVIDLGEDFGLVQPLICYEAIFPALLLGATPRPDWLLQVTNDAWFGTWFGPFQHFAQARLRAIEMGLPLIRVANTGVSAVIDAHGKVVVAAPFDVAYSLYVDEIPGALPPTLYSKLGDLIAYFMTFCLFLLGFRRYST